MQYAIVIERAPGTNYSAYVPDLPGCVATGDTIEEVRRNIREAVGFHMEGLKEAGYPIPESVTQVGYAEVDAATDLREHLEALEQARAILGVLAIKDGKSENLTAPMLRVFTRFDAAIEAIRGMVQTDFAGRSEVPWNR